MRKYISRIILIIIAILVIGAKDVFALHQTGSDVSSIVLYQTYYETLTEWGQIYEEEVLKTLKQDYGYNGDIVSPLRINTNVTITKTSKIFWFSRKYKVKLGNKELDEKYTKEQLVSIFGYEGEEDPKEGTSWPIIIGADVHEPDTTVDPSYRQKDTWIVHFEYTIKASEIWTGNDKPDTTETTDVDIETGSLMGTLNDTLDTVSEFLEDPIGNGCKFLLNILRTIFDGIQIIINMLQTSINHTLTDFRLAYTYDELKADSEGGKNTTTNEEKEDDATETDKGAGNRDMYTKVSEFRRENYKKSWQKYIYIDGDEKGFTTDTEIPVIPVDIYNLAIGNLEFTDINFLTNDEEENNQNNQEESPWKILRNFAVIIIRITIYLGCAILLTILIWHGVNIVKGSLDNPGAQVAHREGLKRFFVALLMLVGSVVIMALCIFANEMFLGKLKSNSNEYELPIRVNVRLSNNGNSSSEADTNSESNSDTKGYSFSTNITGYIRYMAQIEDTDKCLEKAAFTLAYMAIVLLNVVAGIFMFLRMFIMLFLSILGPIVAVLHAVGIENKKILNYKTWAELYVSIAFVQVFLAIAVKIILECSVFK